MTGKPAGQKKRHHFVPVMLLKGFANAEGSLHIWRRGNARIWQSSPEAVFFETGLNTFHRRDGSRSVELEDAYMDLEGAADSVIRRIRAIANESGTPSLSEEERSIFDEFYIHQFARVPSTMNKVFAKRCVEQRLQDALVEWERRAGRPPTAEEMQLLNAFPRATLEQNISVLGRSNVNGDGRVSLELAEMGLVFGVASTPGLLPIGNNPIAQIGWRPGSRLGDPGAHAWLPISHTVAVRHAHSATREAKVALSNDETQAIAAAIRDQSEMLGMSSSDALSRLVAELA